MNAKMKAGHHVFREGTEIIVYETSKTMSDYYDTNHGMIHKRFIEVTDDERHIKTRFGPLFDGR